MEEDEQFPTPDEKDFADSPSPSCQCARKKMISRNSTQSINVPARVHVALRKRGFKVNRFGVMTWLENSPAHPRRWSIMRKAYVSRIAFIHSSTSSTHTPLTHASSKDSAIICFLEFFVTLLSNAGSSLTTEISQEFGTSRETALICLTTVYLIGQALGGLIFPPIAEAFGGRTIYVASTFGYAISCVLIAACPNLAVLVVFRFVGGFLSAMPAVVAAGSIECV